MRQNETKKEEKKMKQNIYRFFFFILLSSFACFLSPFPRRIPASNCVVSDFQVLLQDPIIQQRTRFFSSSSWVSSLLFYTSKLREKNQFYICNFLFFLYVFSLHSLLRYEQKSKINSWEEWMGSGNIKGKTKSTNNN